MEQAIVMGLKLYSFLIIFLFLFVGVIAQQGPPVEQTQFLDKGIQVEVPLVATIKTNQTFEFHAHPHNITDGRELHNDTTWCKIDLYHNLDGMNTVDGNMTYDEVKDVFDITILGGNFSDQGHYSVLVYCEAQGEIGGFFEFSFDVTHSGILLSEGEALIYFVTLLILLALFCFTLYGSIVIPFKDTVSEDDGSVLHVNQMKYLKVFLIVLSYILLFFMTSIVYSITLNFLEIDNIGFAFYYLWVILYAGIWPLLILSVLLLFIKFIQSKEITNALERGVPFR